MGRAWALSAAARKIYSQSVELSEQMPYKTNILVGPRWLASRGTSFRESLDLLAFLLSWAGLAADVQYGGLTGRSFGAVASMARI